MSETTRELVENIKEKIREANTQLDIYTSKLELIQKNCEHKSVWNGLNYDRCNDCLKRLDY